MTSRKRKHDRMYIFLIFLVLLIVLYGFSARSLVEQLILDLIVVSLFVSVVFTLEQTKRSLLVSIMLGIPWIVAVFVDLFVVQGRTMRLLTTVAGIPFLIFVTRVVFWHVLRSRRVTPSAIYGAICVYLLLGIVWAAGYRFLEALNPGSFSGPMGIDPETGLELPNYMYFSFTTLTTLGYGDIVPVTAVARSVAIIEAIAGPLYITILISQLVSKYVSRKVEDEIDDIQK